MRLILLASALVACLFAAALPARAQDTLQNGGVMRTGCLKETSFTQREGRTTRYYRRFTNTCPNALRAHICAVASQDPAVCTSVAMFQSQLLAPGASFVPSVPSGAWTHPQQCQAEEEFVD